MDRVSGVRSSARTIETFVNRVGPPTLTVDSYPGGSSKPHEPGKSFLPRGASTYLMRCSDPTARDITSGSGLGKREFAVIDEVVGV